jgi:hypothetical protein
MPGSGSAGHRSDVSGRSGSGNACSRRYVSGRARVGSGSGASGKEEVLVSPGKVVISVDKVGSGAGPLEGPLSSFGCPQASAVRVSIRRSY